MADRLVIVGVRHHSPASARLAHQTIVETRPAFVLIEGPSDFNDHFDDLRLAHQLPIAIFSYCADASGARAFYTPFAASSPEWRAMQAAWETGAKPLFCDLPAWRIDQRGPANRYADPHNLHARYQTLHAALETKFSAEGQDALWDAVVEQAPPDKVAPILEAYFDALRGEGEHDPREVEREQYMGAMAAWALAEAGDRPVVLICGGWHVAGIRAAAGAADGSPPPPPAPPEGMRAASYLTPYSYPRLASFAGYAAGMPSPAYYERVHAEGLDAAADWAMGAIGDALRARGLPVSTADKLVWRTTALALARLRGHRAPLRADVLDAALSALVKDALERPVAWTRPGVLSRSDDDIVVAMLRALSGSDEGRLAPGVRQPPLVADIQARLDAQGIEPGRRSTLVEGDWRAPEDRPRLQLMRQLLLLNLPGVKPVSGPAHADDVDLREQYEFARHPDWLGAVIEASRFGGDLPMAAAAALDAWLTDRRDDPAALAQALSRGLFAGVFMNSPLLIDDLSEAVAGTHDLGALGGAGRRLAGLFRYGEAFAAQMQSLNGLCAQVFQRLLWLCEGAGADAGAIAAVLAARDLARESQALGLDLAAAQDVFLRLALGDSAAPTLAGAALGYLAARGAPAARSDAIAERILRFGAPDRLGDFLGGLFGVAREHMGEAEGALRAVDRLFGEWSDSEFLSALPALRGAFAWFPPRERERLARVVLQQSGYAPALADAAAIDWMRQRAPISDQAAAMAAEQAALARLARYGLDDFD